METIFEQSNGLETATYEQGIQFYEQLVSNYSDLAHIQSMGLTDSGRPLHLFLISGNGAFEVEEIRKGGKIILLINNAIHPGEPDGVEASMMLARDILADPGDYQKVLDKVVIAIIPILQYWWRFESKHPQPGESKRTKVLWLSGKCSSLRSQPGFYQM